MASQAKFLDFIDMIDGGGAGRMGDRFEGGGIFSALANLIATPYGSEDEGRRASREAFLRSRGLLDDPAVASAAAPAMTGPTRAQRMSAAAAEMERQRGLAQDALDPRGPNQMGVPVAVPASGMQFGQQPAGALPSMSFGQQPVGSMPSMSFGQQPAGSMPSAPPVSTYGGGIDPTQDGRIQAQRNIDNRERLRSNMGQITEAEYNTLSRAQKAELGLPVRPIDLMFAGSDAFKPPMVGSGRGIASGDYEFDRFMNMVRTNPNLTYLMNEPAMAYSVYNRMQQSGTQF